jgi:hypothetical protein
VGAWTGEIFGTLRGYAGFPKKRRGSNRCSEWHRTRNLLAFPREGALHNAGVCQSLRPVWEFSTEYWQWLLGVNFMGCHTWRADVCSDYAAPGM